MAGASAFAILQGPQESGQRILLPRQDRMSFHAGTEDVWLTGEVQDLGDLQSLTLGLHEHVSHRRTALLRSDSCPAVALLCSLTLA